MEKSKERIRLIILSLLVIAIFMTGSLRLMQFQVVNGATFREEANKLTVSQTVIKAARGEIVDRYGRPLATNKVGFNIVFDRAFLPKGEENQIISDLIDLMEKSGVICVPGSSFGTLGEGYVRMALVLDVPTMEKVVQVIKESGILE